MDLLDSEEKDSLETLFIQMIKENERLIYKVASFYVSTDFSIKDIYQEIVLNLWKAFPSFRRESKYSTWIYRIGLNTCISLLRKKKISLVYSNLAFDIPEIIEDNEQIKELYNLVGKLGKIDRALILLYLENRTYKEISEIIGLSLTNVATKLSRAKEKLINLSNS